ncbi:MAG: cupredoxin domain-containing protein [Acidimicrobiia bacterium]|nr:cupredoxin domain-containing protein [Acidimicrobiia bacterium]
MLLVLVISSCSSGSGEPTDSNTSSNPGAASVAIDNFAFMPATLEITSGSTVTWTNAQGSLHTVTADDGQFASDNITTDGTFSFTFETPGTFPYHCAIHPNMTASITVKG